MDRRYALALPLAGILALAAFGLAAQGKAEPGREGMGLAVAMDDYRGVVQERAGYAYSLGHYVGQHRQARQERRGYQVATETLADRHRGLRQELHGYRFALAHMTR